MMFCNKHVLWKQVDMVLETVEDVCVCRKNLVIRSYMEEIDSSKCMMCYQLIFYCLLRIPAYSLCIL